MGVRGMRGVPGRVSGGGGGGGSEARGLGEGCLAEEVRRREDPVEDMKMKNQKKKHSQTKKKHCADFCKQKTKGNIIKKYKKN